MASRFAPVDRPYSAGDPVLCLLLDRLEIRLFDVATGLCYAEYGARFRAYGVDYSHPDICAIESKLVEIGLCRDRGDAVLVRGSLAPSS